MEVQGLILSTDPGAQPKIQGGICREVAVTLGASVRRVLAGAGRAGSSFDRQSLGTLCVQVHLC